MTAPVAAVQLRSICPALQPGKYFPGMIVAFKRHRDVPLGISLATTCKKSADFTASLTLRYSSMPLESCSAKRKLRGNHVHTCEGMCSCICTKQYGHQSLFKHHVSLFYYYFFLDWLSLAWNLPNRQGWVASPSPVSAGIINTPPCVYFVCACVSLHVCLHRYAWYP